MPLRCWWRPFHSTGIRAAHVAASGARQYRWALYSGTVAAVACFSGQYASERGFSVRRFQLHGIPGTLVILCGRRYIRATVAECEAAAESTEEAGRPSCQPIGCKPGDSDGPSVTTTVEDQLRALQLTPAAEERIRREISQYEVVLFMKGTASKPACRFSRQALDILKVSRVPTIRTVNVLEDPELRNGIKRFSNYPYIPQLYVRGEFIGGVEKLQTMHEDGSLKKLFELLHADKDV
ncbi:Grx4 family monothiol glutaredoxin [Babesia caballi]|uniref:Grx4 family monothiol glutaredoxin n=1 Tax=Babesia caballi TaxID=5871 RepID=A0AAV4LS67_BABCB|nr:Grx4 family monothiol glutaredoxin [Babesia caballi]